MFAGWADGVCVVLAAPVLRFRYPDRFHSQAASRAGNHHWTWAYVRSLSAWKGLIDSSKALICPARIGPGAATNRDVQILTRALRHRGNLAAVSVNYTPT